MPSVKICVFSPGSVSASASWTERLPDASRDERTCVGVGLAGDVGEVWTRRCEWPGVEGTWRDCGCGCVF
jgi:hypothetical protein